MKILNYLLLIIVIINNLKNANGVKMVNNSVLIATRYTYYNCYSQYLDESDLCGPGKYICEKIEGTDDMYSVVSVDFSAPNTPLNSYCYVENLHSLTNLTSVFVGSTNKNMRTTGATFGDMKNLQKLKKVTIYYADDFDDVYHNTYLSDSLEELYINYAAKSIPSYIFQGKLKKLHINNIVGTVPELTMENPYLQELKLGFSSPDSNFPSSVSKSFSKYLTNLTDLNLYFYTNTTDTMDLNYKSLVNLELGQDSVISNWTFPTSLTTKSLETLTLKNNIFNFNDGFDFRNYNDNFQFTVSGYETFSTCDKCVKFPTNTTINVDGNLEFASIDFSNVTYFYSESNKCGQTLPDFDDLSNDLKQFYITDGYVYGTIPDDYCKIPFDFSLNDNYFSIMSSCFKCDLNMRSKISNNPILLTSTERDCSLFNYTLSSNSNSLSTKGDSITINGTGLGWQYVIDSVTYSVDIPNTQFTITIPKGVGKNLEKQITFNGQDIETISYSYNIPQITKHDLITINGKKVLIIYGTDLDYEGTNIATFINTETNQTNSYNFENQNDSSSYITSINSDVASLLTNGSTYQLYVTVGNQQSNTIDFEFIEINNSTTSSDDSSSSNSDSHIDTPSNSSKLLILLNLNILILILLIILF